MATIDELMEGKQPGEVKVRRSGWLNACDWFQPFFKVDNHWHGLSDYGTHQHWNDDDNEWDLWQPPKQKYVRYLWVHKTECVLSSYLFTDKEFDNFEPGYVFDSSEWQRLDWSATEMEE